MSNVFLFANDAQSTLAASIGPSDTAILLTPGSGAEFPNPSAGQQFALTLTDAATGLLNEIVYCTARSGDTLTVIRAQEDTVGLSWAAGDLAENRLTAGTTQAFTQSPTIRTRLTGNLALYIRTDGSDANTGLANTAGAAWLTLQHAFNVLMASYDLAGFNVTINMGAGTFAGAAELDGLLPGQVAAVAVSGAGGGSTFITNLISARYSAVISVGNMTIQGSSALQAVASGIIFGGGGLGFGTCSGVHIIATEGGQVFMNNNYEINGGCAAHIACDGQGSVTIGTGINISLNGNYAFGVFANILNGSLLYFAGTPATFSVNTGVQTGPRYSVTANSVIQTAGSGASYLPGTVGGTTSTGGQYI